MKIVYGYRLSNENGVPPNETRVFLRSFFMLNNDKLDTQNETWYDAVSPLAEEINDSLSYSYSVFDSDDEDDEDEEDDNDLDYNEEYGIDEEDEFDDEFGDEDDVIEEEFLEEDFFDDDEDDFMDDDI